jgi:hypothetical protein
VSLVADVGAPESGQAKCTRAAKVRLFSRWRRLLSRVLFTGRWLDSGGTDFGGSRIARKGACSSIGCSSSGGRAGRSSGGTGECTCVHSPVLSRQMYVRTLLTLKTLESSGCLEQET